MEQNDYSDRNADGYSGVLFGVVLQQDQRGICVGAESVASWVDGQIRMEF